MGALFEVTKFSGTLRACEQPETENKMRSTISLQLLVSVVFLAGRVSKFHLSTAVQIYEFSHI